MSNKGNRRRCPQCQQIRAFVSRRQGVCSTECEVARRKAAGLYPSMWSKSAEARRGAKASQLAGLGLLTDREQAIYQRGRRSGYESGRAGAFERGRRAGWAEALNEQEVELTEAQIETRRKGGLALAAKRRAA